MADYVPKMPVPQGPTIGRDTSASLVQARDGHTGTLTADNLVGGGHGEPIGVHPMAVPRAEMRARDRKRQEEVTQERQRAIAERKSKTAAPEEGAGKRWPSLRGLGRGTVLQPTPSDATATTAELQPVTEKVEDTPVAPVAEPQPLAPTPAPAPAPAPAPTLTPALAPTLTPTLTLKQDTKESPEETPEPPQVDAGAPAFAAPTGAGDDALPTDPADEAAPQKKAEQPVKKTGGGKKRSAQPGTMGAQSAPVKFTPQLDQGSEGAMLRSVTSHQGMDMVMALQAGGKQFGKAQIREYYNAKSAVPGIQQPTGMPAGPFQPGNWSLEGTPLAKKPAMKPGSGVLARPFPTEHPLPETKSFWQRFMTQARSVTPTSPANREQAETVGQLQGLVHSSETPQVETSFGPQPHVPLVGDSDPNLARTNADAAHGQTVAELQRRQLDTQVDVGDSLIRPTVAVDTLHYQTEFSTGDTYDYGNPALHEILPEHKSILDADAEGMLREEADKTAAESQRVESDYELERTRHIEEGHAQIAAEESATQERQLNARTTNSDDIASLREDWRGENEVVLDEFSDQCDSEQAEMEAELDEIQLNADGEVTAEITAAEQEAAEAKRKAEERVAKRREEAKKKEAEKSWFDMAVDAVKSFFAELTAFVSQVFDDLRSWVKQKFEQAKKWVVAKIEQARQAIVGAIKWFGEKLKGFVDIAFAAFPKIRDKFKAKIDQAMDATIDFVNEQAERLKVFAQKVLDAMAQMVDAALQVMETLIIAQLKALEFLAVAAIRMAEYFYNMLLDAILKIGTLIAFVGLIASGFLLGFMWEFLGEDTREYLIDLLFDVGIWVFENAPDDFGFGVIWPLFVHGMLGFLYEAQETPMEDKKKIMQKVSDIVTMQDTEFVWAFVKNIFVGIWESIWGIFEGIWELIKFLTGGLWEMLGEMIDWLATAVPLIAETLTLLVGDFVKFVKDFKEEGPAKLQALADSLSIEKIMEFLNGLGDSLRVEAEVMGARAASGMREFMLSGAASAKIGEQLGKLYGMIIFEVVLAVLTVGIGTAIKTGLTAVKWVMRFFARFGKGSKLLSHVFEFLGKGFRWLVKVVRKLAKKFVDLGRSVLAKFDNLFATIEKRIDDLMAKLRGKADEVGEHMDDGPDHRNRPDVDEDPDGRRSRGDDDDDFDRDDDPNNPHRRRDRDDDSDDPNGRRNRDDDPNNRRNRRNPIGVETTTITMLSTPHRVTIYKGKAARIKFGMLSIFTHLRRAKTNEKSAEGRKIDAGLLEVRLKADALKLRAMAKTKGKVIHSQPFRNFKLEVQEFARKFDAKSFEHIADKKGVEEQEFFFMSGERHRLWYDSSLDSDDFWMASGRARHMILKINDQIKSSNDIINEFSGDNSDPTGIANERRLITTLQSIKQQYETDSLNAKTTFRSNGNRQKFKADIDKAIERMARRLSDVGKVYDLKDLQATEFYVYFHQVKISIKDLRKNMTNPRATGDGHNNSAASAEHFGWTNPNGQHWKRRKDERNRLDENLHGIRQLEARLGGKYTSSKLYKEGYMEYMDCLFSTTNPRQYLIVNHVRGVRNLWQAYFPGITFEAFNALPYQSTLTPAGSLITYTP
jgi:hypothetical protein